MNLTYLNKIPVEDYNALRESAGWNPVHPQQAAASLAGSALVVAAMDGAKTVGTARLVWDGGYAALIKDVLVLPEYQGYGIGTKMMNRIMDFLRKQLKPGYGIQIDMMAAQGKEGFYERFGFTSRPRENRGAGMDMWLHS
jgi:GNAT superfamily N-acetyltransferase